MHVAYLPKRVDLPKLSTSHLATYGYHLVSKPGSAKLTAQTRQLLIWGPLQHELVLASNHKGGALISHTPPQCPPVGRLVSGPDAEPGKKPLQFVSVESLREDVCTVLCRRAVDNLDLL